MNTDNTKISVPTPQNEEVVDIPIPSQTSPTEAPSAPETLLWDTPSHAYHSTRLICDEMLPLEKTVVLPDLGHFYPKDEICATIYGESEFNNKAVCKNKNAKGEVTSIDVGICQINSYFHCGQGKTFPSTDYVVAHPEEAVRFMIQMYKTGHINLWIAHKNKSYLKYLSPASKMWALKGV